jgi:predicted small lipoprotein YifL
MKHGRPMMLLVALLAALTSCGIPNDQVPRPIDPAKQDQLNSQP